MNIDDYRDYYFCFLKEQIFNEQFNVCECSITEFIEGVVFTADEYSKEEKLTLLKAMVLDIEALHDKIAEEE